MEMKGRWMLPELTSNEKKLVDKIYDFEPLFDDMLFNSSSKTYELIQCQSKLSKTDEWTDDEIDIPYQLRYFSYSFFSFKVEPSEGIDGYFSCDEQTLCISPKALDNDNVILHEMIHLHEFVINELPLYFHDMVCWALYKDLKNKIPKLDEIITEHAHLLTGSSLYSAGGLHDILFLLKSFDLDISMNYPLGMVFSYGRVAEFKEYTYNKE